MVENPFPSLKYICINITFITANHYLCKAGTFKECYLDILPE